MKQVVINSEMMRRVLDSAAAFQKLVPDAVMVGGSAVSAHIGHRQSFDHDHVLTDLSERFASIFEFLSEQEKWRPRRKTHRRLACLQPTRGSTPGITTGQ
jgi:hypothetical protein